MNHAVNQRIDTSVMAWVLIIISIFFTECHDIHYMINKYLTPTAGWELPKEYINGTARGEIKVVLIPKTKGAKQQFALTFKSVTKFER